MNNLRRIKFRLGQPNASICDYEGMSEKERKEQFDEKDGYLHIFTNESYWDDAVHQYCIKVIGIVEDCSGRIYKVFPENILFVKESDVDWKNEIR